MCIRDRGGRLREFELHREGRDITFDLDGREVLLQHNWRRDGSPTKPWTWFDGIELGRFAIWDSPLETAEDLMFSRMLHTQSEVQTEGDETVTSSLKSAGAEFKRSVLKEIRPDGSQVWSVRSGNGPASNMVLEPKYAIKGVDVGAKGCLYNQESLTDPRGWWGFESEAQRADARSRGWR